MDWNAIGAVGELVGAAAVLITVIYLAIQVRHTRDALQRAVRQSRAEVSRNRLQIRATDKRLNELMVKARQSFGEVTTNPFVKVLMEQVGFDLPDALAVHSELLAEWQYRVQFILDIEELTPGERLEFDNTVRRLYGTAPLTKTWYELHGRKLNPDVVAYIDELLR